MKNLSIVFAFTVSTTVLCWLVLVLRDGQNDNFWEKYGSLLMFAASIGVVGGIEYVILRSRRNNDKSLKN